MDQSIREYLNNLYNPNTGQQQAALKCILELTEQPVNWYSEAWDEILDMLESVDNQLRGTGAQVLASVSKNNPSRMEKDIAALLMITRHSNSAIAALCIKSLWKVAIINKVLQNKITDTLSSRFKESNDEGSKVEKRYDIIDCFRKIYDVVKDDKLRSKALFLIGTEEADRENRQRYGKIWFDLRKVKKREGTPKPDEI